MRRRFRPRSTSRPAIQARRSARQPRRSGCSARRPDGSASFWTPRGGTAGREMRRSTATFLSESDPIGTDVFGAAYPYRGRVNLMEAYAERYSGPKGALLGVRAGRFRTPFGIYSRSDYGYTGFVRPPLIRYDGYWAFSNNWLENGVMITAGVPQLFVEASIGRPARCGTSQDARKGRTDLFGCRDTAVSSSSASVTLAAIRI